ncbi:MAG: hypothetical protein EBR58_07910 [Betaproteobacteria bacterium]|nr:hypothetical protein [Betaproteobacteria bacterium]
MNKRSAIQFIAAGAILMGATYSFAAGTHAGGHGHGTEAIGKPGVAAKVTRTVQIDMTDNMRFTPDTITVRRGETVRFVVKNSGQLKHEFNLGTEKDLKEHYEMMKKFPEMEHDEPNIASVAPGKTGDVIWQFTKSGTVSFACLHPGHYEAGMKGAVKVGAAK